jgi:hypothetical protein
MRSKRVISAVLAGVVALAMAVLPMAAQDNKQAPTVKIPQAGVPQVATIEGNFVRAAYNNEGYVILGYRTANQSVGDEWLLLEVGTTLRDGVSRYNLKRDAISLETPDGTKVPLPTIEEYRTVDLRALDHRASVVRDSINYFPASASQSCRIGFFSDVGSAAMAWNEVELDRTRACLGRLYFKVPGGITYGQHWLDVKFANSLVRVPFRILTKDEEKTLNKHYKDIRKQVKEAFAPPPKKKTTD